MTTRRGIVASAVVLAVVACKEALVPDTSPQSITLSATTASIIAGKTTQLTATVLDGDGNTLDGHSVSFVTGDLAILSASEDGLATSVGKAGSTTVKATLGTLTSNSVTIAVTPDVAKTLTRVTDLPAAPTVGSTAPISVRLSDKFGNDIANATIGFTSSGQASVQSATATTSASGVASMTVTIGNTVGANNVLAKVASVDSVSFAATSVPKPPSTLAKTIGFGASPTVGSPHTIAVKATDPHNNAVPGALVTFSITKGGGSLTIDTVRTTTLGVAAVGIALGPIIGDNEVRALVAGLATPATFLTTTVAAAAASLTKDGAPPATIFAGATYDSIRVTVKDAHGNVKAGALVAFAVTAGGGSVSPATVTTNANGKAAARFTTGASAAANVATATITGVPAATFTITTIEPVKTVAVVAPLDSVLTRDSVPATATAKDKDGIALNRAITWASSAPLIATVSSPGRIKGVAPGSAYIRATSEGKSDSVLVRVYTPPVATVSMDVPSDLIVAGATTEIATVLARAARGDTITHRPVTWTSSTPGVATIDPTGRITAIAAGSSTLTATVDGKSDTHVITVEPRSRYENPRCPGCIFKPNLDPRHPIFDQARNGSLPNPNDTRQQITVDETFTVPAGQTVVWDNLIVWVRPTAKANIFVRGTLIIKNSAIFWDQTSPQQTSLEVLSGGVLRVRNSIALQTNLLLFNFNYRDGSTIEFDHFYSDAWTALEGAVKYTAVNASTVHLTPLIDTRNSTIIIRDAMSLSLELYTPPGTYEITFPTKFTWKDWTINSMWPGTTLSATNSYMSHLSAAALVAGAHVTVKDADDFILSWAINKNSAGIVQCELRGLGDPTGVPKYYADQKWDLPCVNSSLTLKNTMFVNAGIYSWGNTRVKIYDSNLADPHVFGGPSIMEIYNSYALNTFALNTGRLYMENVKIEREVVSSGNGSFVYGYNVTSAKAIPHQTYQVDGGKYFGLTSPGSPWP